MVNESFCAACQQMLAMKEVVDSERPHHADEASFRQALDTQCAICTKFWSSIDRPESVQSTTWEVLQNGGKWSLCLYHGTRFREYDVKPCLPNRIHADTQDSILDAQEAWLSENTGSAQSFAFVQSQYQQCVSKHTRCARVATKSFLPTRLLDVGHEQLPDVKLVDREQISQGSSYVTLSHCWGQVTPLKLTKSSVSTLRCGIVDDDLPKTFRDAVLVVRKMRMRYLWIDSLCIFQDKLDDWSTEAASMRNVYQCAAFNIAANAAKDSSEGLFFPRDPGETQTLKIDAAWIPSNDTATSPSTPFQSYRLSSNRMTKGLLNMGPLNRRAWGRQERYLSRRIVHFSNKEIFWECHESYVSETHPDGIDLSDRPLSGLRYITLELGSHSGSNANDDRTALLHSTVKRDFAYIAWSKFVVSYSACDLTYWDDRLVAIQGIAQDFASIVQDELVAGLWRSRLVKELCWFMVPGSSDPGIMRDGWVAPTWSWVSCASGVTYASHIDDIELVDAAQVVDVRARSKKSGALTDGILTLRCRPVTATIDIDAYKIAFKSNTTSFPWKYGNHWRILLDSYKSHIEKQFPVFLVVLRCRGSHTGLAETMSGLILIRSTQDGGVYERAGVFLGSFKSDATSYPLYNELADRLNGAEEQIISII